MLKFLGTLSVLLVMLTGCDIFKPSTPAEIQNDKIYFFYYNECPYCHHAMDYLKKNHPDLKITMVNIHQGNGFELLKKCAEKFKLGNSVGTPLFCMGSRYLMGWSPNSGKRFEEYLRQFNAEQ